MDQIREALASIDATQLIKAWSPYMKPGWKPLPLQLAFCILPNKEILFGGSAGGSKSEALLAAALQYTHVPGYSAIIYRKSYQDLIRPGALLDRCIEWLTPFLGKEVKYDPSNHIFTFLTSGAKLAFGHMGRKGAADTMQGAEFSFVGIDEVTQHTERDALYALSRLRRKANEDFPLRARFTANPGGIGHNWVRERFKMIKNRNYDPKNPHSPMYIGNHPTRLFIPSKLSDNPHIDQVSYTEQLKELDPITRARLLEGDWSAAPFGRFKPEWFNRYKHSAGYVVSKQEMVNFKQLHKFATIDVAASFAEGVGGRQFYTSSSDATDISAGDPCWTVCATWGVANGHLYLLDVLRQQTEIPEVFHMMDRTQKKWGRIPFAVEKNGVGTGVVQGALRLGYMVEPIWTSKDKILNSYDAANMAEQGKIFIPAKDFDEEGNEKDPADAPWLSTWEAEVFSWMGLKDETSDQVDTLSTAARRVSHLCLNKVDNHHNPCRTIPKVYGEFVPPHMRWGGFGSADFIIQ